MNAQVLVSWDRDWELLAVAEDAENFRCGGGLLDYVQILYGNKSSQQKYGLEVPQMKKNT